MHTSVPYYCTQYSTSTAQHRQSHCSDTDGFFLLNLHALLISSENVRSQIYCGNKNTPYIRFRKVLVTPQVSIVVSWHQRCTLSPEFT